MKKVMHIFTGVIFCVLTSAGLILKLNNIGFGQPKIPTVMAAMSIIPNNERQPTRKTNISLTVIHFALILTQKIENTLNNILMLKNPENHAKCTCWRVLACAGLCWLVLV